MDDAECIFLMKRHITLIVALISLFGCNTYYIDGDGGKDDKPSVEVPDIEYARVNIDANSPEIATVVSENGDTVAYYGVKNGDGTAKECNLLKIASSSSDLSALVRFDAMNRPSSVVGSNGVTIDLEWESDNSAVVKVFNPADNTYITTLWKTDSLPEDEPSAVDAKSGRHTGLPRNGKLGVRISPFQHPALTKGGAVSDYPASQSCTFSIYQCDYPVNADNWIGMVAKEDGEYIENIYYQSNPETGVYTYTIPLSSYPSAATNEELCENIDNILTVAGFAVSYLAAMESGLAVWLNYVAVMTGIGVIPAAITDVLILVTAGANVALTMIDNAGGVENIMKSLNPEWYYREYIISDIELIPVINYNGSLHFAETKSVSPDDGHVELSHNLYGIPVIDSFDLIPSHPVEGQSYQAIATFHCVPAGSEVEVSIIGTDGYADMISTVTDVTSGTVTLNVPGAETGVYDVCTVVIRTPDGQEYSMQASLVFGS